MTEAGALRELAAALRDSKKEALAFAKRLHKIGFIASAKTDEFDASISDGQIPTITCGLWFDFSPTTLKRLRPNALIGPLSKVGFFPYEIRMTTEDECCSKPTVMPSIVRRPDDEHLRLRLRVQYQTEDLDYNRVFATVTRELGLEGLVRLWGCL